jgi:hypothetical protein
VSEISHTIDVSWVSLKNQLETINKDIGDDKEKINIFYYNIIGNYLEISKNEAIITSFSNKIQTCISDYVIIQGQFIFKENEMHNPYNLNFYLKHPITQKELRKGKFISIIFNGSSRFFNPSFLSSVKERGKFSGTCLVKILDWDEENLSLILLPIAIF